MTPSNTLTLVSDLWILLSIRRKSLNWPNLLYSTKKENWHQFLWSTVIIRNDGTMGSTLNSRFTDVIENNTGFNVVQYVCYWMRHWGWLPLEILIYFYECLIRHRIISPYLGWIYSRLKDPLILSLGCNFETYKF